MIKECKLNSCAHCATKTNLHAVFSTCGKLYFICTPHKFLLDCLRADAAKMGITL